jgi:Saxitoxin biosynthesis operon protein SxtJ
VAGQGGLATKVRTRLEVIDGGALKKPKPSALDELYFGKPVGQHVQEFGALFSVIFLVISAVLLYKGRPIFWPSVLISSAAIFTFLGYKAPAILKPVWSGWMKFAHVLGFVMTNLILFLAWSLMFVPMAIGLRLFGRKVMDVGFRMPVDSYWENRDEKYNDFRRLERQY